MSSFELLPAIDLRGGRVVRLRQGDFERETAYADDPSEVAERFAADGATWLHVVDLDGARAGAPVQLEATATVVAATAGRVRVEVAGGLRSAVAVAGALATGAARAVIGTAALRDPAFAGELVARHGPDRIAVAIDVRAGIAVGEGWRPGAAGLPAAAAIPMLADAGVRTFEVTAIERDGLLEGPDVPLLRALVDLGRGRIIASGGIASVEDVIAVQAAGCGGAIVGRALYEGRVTLGALIEAVSGAAGPG